MPGANPPHRCALDGIPAKEVDSQSVLLTGRVMNTAEARRVDTLAQAQRQLLPLKVRLPEHLMRGSSTLNPTAPAKKKPLFPSEPGAVALDTHTPCKKRVPDFLLETPRSVLVAAGAR